MTKTPPVLDEIDKLMVQDAGKGISRRWEESADWLPDDLHDRPWIGAIITVDKSNGVIKEPLLNLLHSDEPIRYDERGYLADLLWRRKFRDKVVFNLLRGTEELTREQRRNLAEQLARQKLNRPPGPPATPEYQLTEPDARLKRDAERVRQLRMHGGKPGGIPMDFESAVDKVAPNIKYANKLARHMLGQLGSTARKEKRRRPKT